MGHFLVRTASGPGRPMERAHSAAFKLPPQSRENHLREWCLFLNEFAELVPVQCPELGIHTGRLGLDWASYVVGIRGNFVNIDNGHSDTIFGVGVEIYFFMQGDGLTLSGKYQCRSGGANPSIPPLP
jgi:hypothetical protein